MPVEDVLAVRACWSPELDMLMLVELMEQGVTISEMTLRRHIRGITQSQWLWRMKGAAVVENATCAGGRIRERWLRFR